MATSKRLGFAPVDREGVAFAKVKMTVEQMDALLDFLEAHDDEGGAELDAVFDAVETELERLQEALDAGRFNSEVDRQRYLTRLRSGT